MPAPPAGDPTGPAPGAPRRRRSLRWSVRLGAVAGLMALVLALSYRPLLVGYARLFRVHDPAPSGAIVVLQGQWTVRPVTAAGLYRAGLAPVVLMGATDPVPYPDLCESALNRRVLIRAGVPPGAIRVLPGPVTSTSDEALRVRDYLRTHPMRRITVVTTAFHAARARWIFRRVLRGMGVEVRVAAARDPRFDESDWYRSALGRSCYLSEAPKVLYYRLRY